MRDAMSTADTTMHFRAPSPDACAPLAPLHDGTMYKSVPITARSRRVSRLCIASAAFLVLAIVTAIAIPPGPIRHEVRGSSLIRHDTVVTTRSIWAATTPQNLPLLLDGAARGRAWGTGAVLEIPARMNLLVTERGNGWLKVTGAGLAPVYVRADQAAFALLD